MQEFGFHTVELDRSIPAVVILDQTRLPRQELYLTLTDEESLREAIYHLKVRGAPAIGVAAALGIYVCMAGKKALKEASSFQKEFSRVKDYLASARPTAVNLFWALERMEGALKQALRDGKSVPGLLEALEKEALAVLEEDRQICRSLGENGLRLLKPGMGILTHCNAGALATAGMGTALAPVYLGQQRGYGFHVFADETRPLLQGARLTCWELSKAGVDVTLICDNMASMAMKNGWIQAVITGCDRVAANGDSANKIGTSAVAILAKEYGIPFYIAAPLSTIDANCREGKDIRIEERAGKEISEMWYTHPMAPEGIKTYNPAFDVTDHRYITALITEKGILRPPFTASIRQALSLPEG